MSSTPKPTKGISTADLTQEPGLVAADGVAGEPIRDGTSVDIELGASGPQAVSWDRNAPTKRGLNEHVLNAVQALYEGVPKALVFHHGATGAVSAKVFGQKVGSAGGGGYDKHGAALGQFLEAYFQEELQEFFKHNKTSRGSIDPVGYYGAFVRSKDGAVLLDGACGIETMRAIMEDALGISMVWGGDIRKDAEVYILQAKKPK
jgi:hypothetical protein